MVSIAQNSKVFKDQEIKVLHEVLLSAIKGPESGYIILTEENTGVITGFMICGRTPCTDMTWDIFWLVVADESHGKGVAKKLIERVEQYVLSVDQLPILRVETSSRKEYAKARAFYRKSGFVEVGSIPDFYSKDDNLVTYYKKPAIATPQAK